MVQVREALERSWDAETAYERTFRLGVPALGQCYPTARVLQMLFATLEIVEGTVWTGMKSEKHFWNLLAVDRMEYHLDLTWQQFPPESEVRDWPCEIVMASMTARRPSSAWTSCSAASRLAWRPRRLAGNRFCRGQSE
jgi:hypothetical protein